MTEQLNQVVCTAAVSECSQANYGIGCYHRLPHEPTDNCRCGTSVDDGTHLCSVVKQLCACREDSA